MVSLHVAALACPATLGGFDENLQKIFACLKNAHTEKIDLVLLPLGALGGIPLGGLAHMPSFIEAETQALATLVRATSQWHSLCALGVRIIHAGALRNAVALCARGRLWGLIPQTTPGPWPELEEGIQTSLPHGPTTMLPTTTWRPPHGQSLSPSPIAVGPLLFRWGAWSLVFGLNEVELPSVEGLVFCGLCQAHPWHFDANPHGHFEVQQKTGLALARANLCGGGGEWLFAGSAALAKEGHCRRTPPLKPALIKGQFLGSPSVPPLATTACIELPFGPAPSSWSSTPQSQGMGLENVHLLGLAPTPPSALLLHPLNPRANAQQRGENRAPVKAEETQGEEQTLGLLWEALSLGLGEYIEAAGCFQCLGLGLSGGRDSALSLLVAWRWAKSKGIPLKNIYAFSMPSSLSSAQTRKAAQTLAEELGVSFAEHSIAEAFQHERAAVEKMLGHAATEITLQNIQARIRAMRLWNWSNSAQALFLQTGNHSEKAVGYSTLGGDFSGGFAPLADLPKTWINRLLAHIYCHMPLEGLGQILALPAGPELAKGQITEAELLPFAILDVLLEGFLGEGLRGEALLGFAKHHLPHMEENTLREGAKKIQKLVFLNQHKWHHAAPGLRLYSKSLRRFHWPLGHKLKAD
ncbi:MAG: NAD(+) synthase [Cystobacterineae bacterium]|nr:NAD(+) synthase [Cystobacterineae bacterium]